ncbi:MAG: phosphoribosylformylglycinamidine synthase [Deltaproteobacteria bacterium RBG_16_71_12]|nr:MAG: phosphoribosylformylglycinamidine synthase [Deltaproteobacteria bacterium RBG_16_71_12]
MRARVIVRLKPAVLDPQGEAVERALLGLGFSGVKNVRVGKLIELDVDGDAGLVKAELSAMADKLLANPVIEDYQVEVSG